MKLLEDILMLLMRQDLIFKRDVFAPLCIGLHKGVILTHVTSLSLPPPQAILRVIYMQVSTL